MTRSRRNLRALLALAFGGWCGAACAQTSIPETPTGFANTPGVRRGADALSGFYGTTSDAVQPTLTGLAGTPADAALQPTLTGAAGTQPANLAQEAKDASESLFRVANTGLLVPTRLGYGQGQVQAALPLAPQLNIPLLEWQARPEDAQLRLGRFYLQFRALSASVLASDNIDQTENNRRFGTISAVRLEMQAYIQLLENLRLAAGGTIVWLPFRNEIGFDDPLADFEISVIPLALMQLSYQLPLGHWEVSATDQFLVRHGGIGTGRSFDLLNRNATDLEDRAGRYAFSERQSPSSNTRRFQSGVEYHNLAGFTASRILPTNTRLTLGFTHDNIWYSQNPLALPSSQDVATIALESERDSLRFKPFITYRASSQSSRNGWDHEVRGGVRGPVTDYLDFLGDGGFFMNDDPGQTGYLWRLRLTHNPRESMRHSIEYRRAITYPVRDLETTVEYRLEQTIGPDLLGEIALSRSTFEVLDNSNTGSEEKRAEGRLTWAVNPRASFRAGLAYSDVNSFAAGAADYRLWTGRLEFRHATYGKLTTVAVYQHERRESTAALDSYYENLVTLTLRKEF